MIPMTLDITAKPKLIGFGEVSDSLIRIVETT